MDDRSSSQLLLLCRSQQEFMICQLSLLLLSSASLIPIISKKYKLLISFKVGSPAISSAPITPLKPHGSHPKCRGPGSLPWPPSSFQCLQTTTPELLHGARFGM